ncbi:glycoside hydrolase domain-containing protein [Amycolatopsis sp. NPDC051071]|uniref:glycoside hydrolase domain-containing protein n=1 Tax=Amycolatopsis sp. NPDC051071 TaxID=3154637 RepID=UPI00343BB89C
MAYWLDYSAAKLSGAVIKAAGYGGVIRYIDAPDRLRTKHTNLAEYRDHIANGLTVRLVMQNTTTDADGGFAAGVANAQRAKAGADLLGYTGVIYFTNDRTTVPNPRAWIDYLDGAASVLGLSRTGAYGFRNALDLAKGHAAAFWQAGRKSELVGHANFWQDNNTQVRIGGITCDRNLVIADYHPEEDMAFTPEDFNRFMWGNVFDDGTKRNFAQFLKDMDTRLATLAAKAAGASAEEIAAKILPALTTALVAEVAKIDAISDEDATQIAQAVTARAGALLGGAA